MKKILCIVLSLVFILSFAACAANPAQTETQAPSEGTEAPSEDGTGFPQGAITLVNSSDAGSASDLIARAAAQAIAENCSATIMVDDKPGGSGAVANAEVANAKNDGYTIILSLYGHTLLTAALADVGYSNDSFTHICMLASAPFTFCARPDTYADYDAMVEAFKSGETINVGVPGATSGPAVYLQQFLNELEIGDNVQAIPYDSGSSAAAALMGGDLDVVCLPCSETMKYHVTGELKVLLVCGGLPHSLDETIPCAADVGLECRGELWYGVSAPAGISDEVLNFYEKEFEAAYESELLQDVLNNIGAIPAWMGYEEFSAYCAEQWDQLMEVQVAS